MAVPSRLQVNPASPRGHLYVERAIESVWRQTVAKGHDISIFLGVDDDGKDLRNPRTPCGVNIAVGGHSQAEAVNAAAQLALLAAKPDVLCFLEDDDAWHPQKLEYQLAALDQGFDFVSCSQREVTPDGDYVRVNDFATASGWAMSADLWRSVGQMDPVFRWHLDNDWIGRLNSSGAKRLHLAEHAACDNPRPWLKQVSAFSQIAVIDGLLEPLVTRTVNPEGGMARIARDPVAREESRREHEMLLERHGVIPW